MLSLFYPDWQQKVFFSSAGPKPQVLMENEKLKVLIVGLEAGQRIPQHPEVLAVYHILAGTGWMLVDGERLPLQPGATLITPNGIKRGVEAKTQLVFLACRIA